MSTQTVRRSRRIHKRGAGLVLLAAVALSLAGCGVSANVPESSANSPQVQTSDGTESMPSLTSSVHAASPTATASTVGPTAQATAAAWKTYTDPGKSVSFELPADWTTQLRPGPTADALQVTVNDSSGARVATLQTHITGLGGACPPGALRPYTVLASIPLQIPSNSDDASAVEPRYVYRLIQGATRFYASYGITDHAAGKDGKACLVYNTVNSDKLGIYMFGDVLQFTSAPNGTDGLEAFATIAAAQAHMLTGEYRNIERMVTSLKALG